MNDFDCLLQIKKNVLEEVLGDFDLHGIQDKRARAVIEGMLKAINDVQIKSIENTDEYKTFIDKVEQKLTLENPYIQAHEPERNTYEEVDDEDGRHAYPYHVSDDEALELATDDLFTDKNDLEEFITGYVPEYLDLLKVIIERARK